MDVKQYQASLQEEISAKQQELERLSNLQNLYTNLRRYEGRWKKVVWCSKSVNAIAKRFEQRHNCGCCSDSPLELWIYAETEFGNVYTDPPKFVVGENSMYGDRPRPGWKEEL